MSQEAACGSDNNMMLGWSWVKYHTQAQEGIEGHLGVGGWKQSHELIAAFGVGRVRVVLMVV